jgi:hypothetical protein
MIRKMLLLAVLGVEMASAAMARQPVPGRPLTPPQEWLSTGDYPASAA